MDLSFICWFYWMTRWIGVVTCAVCLMPFCHCAFYTSHPTYILSFILISKTFCLLYWCYYILRQKLLHFELNRFITFCVKSYYILRWYYILRQKLLHFAFWIYCLHSSQYCCKKSTIYCSFLRIILWGAKSLNKILEVGNSCICAFLAFSFSKISIRWSCRYHCQ